MDSFRDINESADDAYEQLKALLVSRYTKARRTRAFKILKCPKLEDMKTNQPDAEDEGLAD